MSTSYPVAKPIKKQIIRLLNCVICGNPLLQLGRYDVSKDTCSAGCASTKWIRENPQKKKEYARRYYVQKTVGVLDVYEYLHHCKCEMCKIERSITNKIQRLAYSEKSREINRKSYMKTRSKKLVCEVTT